MTINSLSDTEAMLMVEEARAQLDQYLKLAQLVSGLNRGAVVQTALTYSWDNPMRLTVTGSPHAVMVQPSATAGQDSR